jgi:NAD(P)-dependent dehydrogenase (short-subunit alcohol dehydrogenase family)
MIERLHSSSEGGEFLREEGVLRFGHFGPERTDTLTMMTDITNFSDPIRRNSSFIIAVAMQGFHLYRFLPGTPPGPHVQALNALLHQEPYASIAYTAVWSLLLMFGAPLAFLVLMNLLVYELFCQYVWKRRRIVPSKDHHQELAVIITGCDSGFGKELAFRLASEGFHVFAGILQESSKENFQGVPSIHPLLLDVTKDKHVQQAHETVEGWIADANRKKKKQRCLHALVNNAGIARFGLIDWTTLDDYEICMQVNCYGPIRMVKSFLPLLKKQVIDDTYHDSQIINVVSCAGMLSAGGGGGTPYEVSKHAVEAFTDSLRLEMKTFGIKVVAVNPSFHATDMVQSADTIMANETVWQNLSPIHQKEYGKDFVNTFTQYARTMINSSVWDFKVVVDQLVNILQSTAPPAQVVIGMDFRYGLVGLRMFPQWVRHRMMLLLLPNLTPAILATQRTENENKAKEA